MTGNDPQKRYAVVFTAKPAVKLVPAGASYKLQFKRGDSDEVKISIREIFQEDSRGTRVPVGLKLRVEVYAESLQEAIARAREWASGVTAIISFVSNVGIPIFRLELAYDATPNVENREFIQFFYDASFLPPSIGHLQLEPFISTLEKLVNLPTGENVDRVQRAIAHYAKGIVEEDPIDQYISFWLGLEALNPLLKEDLSAPDEVRRCPRCGYEQRVPSTTGVKHFISSNFEKGPELYRRMRDLRVGIVHSTRPLSEMVPEILELLPLVRETLRRAISHLLNTPIPEIDAKHPVSNVVPLVTAVEAEIVGAPDEKSLMVGDEDPCFIILERAVEPRVDELGRVNLIVKSKLKPLINPPASFKVKAWRIYGERGKIREAKLLGVEKSSG